MPELIIKIKDKIAKPLNNCVICSNSDYTVKFIFDEEWEKEPLRIARFIWNKQYVDVQFTGDTCEVPIISKTNNLAIGVYAGDLRTTTPAILTCYTSILCEDVIEHSVTPSEYEEIMKLLNAQATDIAALKATDKRIWTNLDTINRTASTAKTKAEEGVAKADSALARNIFTDEEKAKLASITNPIIIKGRVDTVNDLPTEAVIGWFYFVGLESASSYEEYCYSENGWEYIGLSQEGVDLSNYYNKNQIEEKIRDVKIQIISNTSAIESLNKDVGDSVADIYSEITSVKNTISPLQDNVNVLIDEKNLMGSRLTKAETTLSNVKTTAETAETKADNALTQASSNTTNINSLRTDVNALKSVDERLWTNLDIINRTASTAKTKAEEGVAKADDALTATRTNATNINAHANDIAINRTTLGTQCKNLLKNTAVTKTVNGVTFTVNDDSTITANGTATSRIIFLVGTAYISQTGNYTYTGTPSGGASSTYSMNYRNSNAYKTVETGNGITTQFEGRKTYEAVIDIRSGVTISNLTFYPMLRDANITDDTYEPYKENMNERLIKNKSNIAVNKTTLGYQSKNLLKLTLTTKTVSGITFTVNDDYSITLNGTSTAIIWQEIGAIGGNNFRKEKLIFTGNPAGTGSGAGLEAWYMNSTTGNKYVAIANGDILTESEYDSSGAISYEFHINRGKTYNNVTFYPMLRYADITDDTYEPYKESVDERLIKNKSDIAVNKSTLGYQQKNLFNETEYLSSITSVSIGTFNISGNSITLTATGKDCYTKPHTNSDGGYRIPVEPDTDYILSWESDNTYAGLVYVFMNGNLSQQKHANNKDTKYIKFTTNSDTTFITFRLGVATSGNSITYSNIMLRYADILDDTYEPYKSSVDARINTINSKINGAYFPLTAKKLIADSTDLNTLTEIGNYICYTASSAATMVNCPTKAGGFKLVVTNVLESSDNNTTIRYQWIIPNNLSDVLCFRRRIDMSTDTFSNWYSFKSYQPGLQEQIPYSISVPGKSTSAAISYNGVPTLICLTPNTADSTAGGLYMINSAGAVIKLIAETGIVVATNTANNTFTITNNTTTVMDVCISRCWGR